MIPIFDTPGLVRPCRFSCHHRDRRGGGRLSFGFIVADKLRVVSGAWRLTDYNGNPQPGGGVVNLFRDLSAPKWMYLKAALFLLILISCSGLLLLDAPTWRTAIFVILLIWSTARLYYFMFYVIEKYIDPDFRYAGIGSALSHLWGRMRGA